MQFEDLPAANRLLEQFFSEHLAMGVDEVHLRPLPVSLNSINGLLRTGEGKQFFFKAHVEPTAAEREYYNSDLLEQAGYPILKPVLRISGTLAEHVLFYEVVTLPTMFEAMHTADQAAPDDYQDLLRRVHANLDDQLYRIYRATLQNSAGDSPVNQLFYGRLTGGRLDSFYSDSTMYLPKLELSFRELCSLKWVINGVSYPESLGAIIEHAIETLVPSRLSGPSIIGHGDAHNGNLFLDADIPSVTYFDPAFAGIHSPFLDLPKPLFHNTYGQWLYFPQEAAGALDISVRRHGNTLYVDHNYTVPSLRWKLCAAR